MNLMFLDGEAARLATENPSSYRDKGDDNDDEKEEEESMSCEVKGYQHALRMRGSWDGVGCVVLETQKGKSSFFSAHLYERKYI